MARNDDGEFELMVGNRQLLTIVGIIFVLCGIVFTLGYVVGRNSGPPVSAAAVGRDAPLPSQPAGSTKPPAAAEADAANAQLQPGEVKLPAPQTEAPAPEPQQQQPSAPTERAASVPPAKTATPQSAPKPAQQKPAEASAALGLVREPVPGQTYVQVAAVARTMAETVVDVLQSKAFPAFMSPSSKPGLFRVLVGPVSGAPAIAKMKADIEAVGFKDTHVAKY